MKQKGFGIVGLVIIVAIALVCLGVWSLYRNSQIRTATQNNSPSTIDTASWKTWNEYGLAFSYPATWIAVDGGSIGNLVNVYLTPNGSPTSTIFAMAGSRGCRLTPGATTSSIKISTQSWTRIDKVNEIEICRNTNSPGGGDFIDVGYDSTSSKVIAETVVSTLISTGY